MKFVVVIDVGDDDDDDDACVWPNELQWLGCCRGRPSRFSSHFDGLHLSMVRVQRGNNSNNNNSDVFIAVVVHII